MNWPQSCAIVIPCFNEARHIRQVVSASRVYLPNVFVVDDGSHDLTCDEARLAGAHTLRHSGNLGKGAALATGLAAAIAKGFTWALVMDGDGQHAPGDIPKFLECADKTQAPLIIGNRMGGAGQMPLLRRLVNRWMSHCISVRARRRLPDTQCGFRLINLRVWRGLELQAQHFEVESEILLAFVQAGQRVEFVPIEVIYKDEQSKIRPWSDTLRWIRWWRRASRTSQRLSTPRFEGTFAGLQENSRSAVD